VPLRPAAGPGRQLSIFSVEAYDPSPADLAGLLAGPGQLHRIGGSVRVSVRVDAAWRVHVLLPELAARGLEASWLPASDDEPAPAEVVELERVAEPEAHSEDPEKVAEAPEPDIDDEDADPGSSGEEGAGGEEAGVGFEVRTAYSGLLSGLGRAWLDGAAKRAPERFFLSGPRLRLWAAAAGFRTPSGYVLRLGADDGLRSWEAVDAALTRAGAPGTILPGLPGYRIAGRRRLTRLAELVGERPPAAPSDAWPGV
jgi:hypothetical protein